MQQGHTVIIATLDFLGAMHKDPPYVKRLPCPLKFKYKTNRMAVPWRPTKQIYTLVKQLQPDIIHVHHPFLLGSSALAVAKTLHIPIVFTYHTMYEHYAHYIPLPITLTQWMLRRIVPNFCHQVNGIIAPSNTIKSMLDTFNLQIPITVLPSSIREPFLPASSFTPKQPAKQFKLLHVGRLVQEKNIPFLIELMKHLPQDQFTLTIIGYGAAYEELRNYAYQTLRLSPKQLCFIHKPEKDIIAHAYRDADLFLFSSCSDTQAIVLAESMAAGTPVLALDGPGQRDIITQGHNGYIAHTKDEMIEYIQTIADNKALHEQLQYEAWLTSQRYKPDQIIDKLLEFYRSIMESDLY